jgi:hypothetical protein
MNIVSKFARCSVAATLLALSLAPNATAQMEKVKTVWVIMMENHNWTGNNAGAAFGAPDIKGNPLAPYINGELIKRSAHAERYFNPPQNHPSLPNYLWLEAGTNFGILTDNLPTDDNLNTTQHLTALLEQKNISWRTYAEPDFGNPVYDDCPLGWNEVDPNHVPQIYFSDMTDGFNAASSQCISHVRPYHQLATDLADHTVARYNLIVPNTCDDGHEGVSPCDTTAPADNTARSDEWLRKNVPLITNSREYREGGALFIIWDEGEDSGVYRDGPIGMFLLSPFAKGHGEHGYTNYVHYDHSSTLKTIEEIFDLQPLLGAAADDKTKDLCDLFHGGCGREGGDRDDHD